MRFERNSQNWNTIEQGEKDCFLLTERIGWIQQLVSDWFSGKRRSGITYVCAKSSQCTQTFDF